MLRVNFIICFKMWLLVNFVFRKERLNFFCFYFELDVYEFFFYVQENKGLVWEFVFGIKYNLDRLGIEVGSLDRYGKGRMFLKGFYGGCQGIVELVFFGLSDRGQNFF